MYQQASQADGFGHCKTLAPCCWLKTATGPWDPRPKSEGAKTGILRDHVPSVPPPPPPPPPTDALLAFGFMVAGAKKVLLVNRQHWHAHRKRVGGRRRRSPSRLHRPGPRPRRDVLPGSEVLGASGSVEVHGYGISVLTLKAE